MKAAQFGGCFPSNAVIAGYFQRISQPQGFGLCSHLLLAFSVQAAHRHNRSLLKIEPPRISLCWPQAEHDLRNASPGLPAGWRIVVSLTSL